MSFGWKYDAYSGKEYKRPFIERAGIVAVVGGLGLAAIVGARAYINKDEEGGSIGLPVTPSTALIAVGALAPFPGELMCSPEKSTVVVDDRSLVDGNHSLYRAINVNFGEETDIGIPGGNPIQGTPTEAFVLKVAEESGIAVTDVNNVPAGTYQVRSICNGPSTSWNANSTAV